MVANKFVILTALVSGTYATTTSDGLGEPFYNCTAPTVCRLTDGGETCESNPRCCGFPETPASWIENDPRDTCTVMQTLCERGVDFETSSFARCHAYLSGETTYVPADVDVPADCDYKCDEETAETAAERRRRQNADNAVSVSLADCQQWVFDNLQLERGSENRGTGVKIAVMRGGVDLGHEAAPPLERIARACDVSEANHVEEVPEGEWSPPKMKIDCAKEITYDELKRVVSPNNRDDKTTSTVTGLLGSRTETGVEGIVPDAILMHYKIFNEYAFGATSWFYNAMIDAVDNGAEVVVFNTGGGTTCDEDFPFTPFVPTAEPPLPYWANFTAEQNATWPADRLMTDIEEFDALTAAEQDTLIAALPEAMAAYNEEWAKENAVYQEAKAAFVKISREHAVASDLAMYEYAYNNNVFIVKLVSANVEEREAQGYTNCVARFADAERQHKPYLIGGVDVTNRRVASQSSGKDAGGANAMAPGGDLFFGGSTPPNLQPTLAVMAPTTCQYRVMWTATESTTQDKLNYYEANFGNAYALTHASGVVALAVQAIKARGETATVLTIDEELKKYLTQEHLAWCEADGNCEEYGAGLLSAKVQA